MTEEPAEDLPDFGFTDDEGNARMRMVLQEVAANARSGELGRTETIELLSDRVRDLSERYPEATDITVREAVMRELEPVFDSQGWTRPEAFEF
jgi:hypothetical protein